MFTVLVYLWMILSSSSIAASAAAADHASYEGQNQVIHVGGRVLCQDCTLGYNEWVNGTKPLKGSKVSATCLDDRRRVVYYGSDLTDSAGNFDILINKYVNGKELKPQNCYLRLVSSSDPVCNIATDFGGGKGGVTLRQPTVICREALKYTVGPFYYTTPMCDEPDTSTTELSYANTKH